MCNLKLTFKTSLLHHFNQCRKWLAVKLSQPLSHFLTFPNYLDQPELSQSLGSKGQTLLCARFHTPQGTPLTNTPPPPDPLAQYLAQWDPVTSGLYQFNDKPENFCAWQSSFTNAVAEVSLTATQELHFMTKWLGKHSGEQVRRRRSVHINNPILAFNKACERLHDCYACPEII